MLRRSSRSPFMDLTQLVLDPLAEVLFQILP
jgi:hypothetical protein